MIRLKTTILVVILMVLATFAVGITAETVLNKNEQKNIKNVTIPQSLSEAKITFYVLTGEGCACEPIPDVSIFATGGEGSDSNVTDKDGMCVLTLVILGEYEVFIEHDEYQKIYFEFDVIDDQTFIFHMFEKKESSVNTLPSLHNLITKILTR